jgi:hypothetical protein
MSNLKFIFIGFMFGLYSYFLFNPVFFGGPGDIPVSQATGISAYQPEDEKLGGGVKVTEIGIGDHNPYLTPSGPGGN